MNKTIYLDMDSVICDFDKEYKRIVNISSDAEKFKYAVMEHKIFSKLDFMPNGYKLLKHVCEDFPDFRLCILSSLGTHNIDVAKEGRRQKVQWLQEVMEPSWKFDDMYFVLSFAHKKHFANKFSMLIDDRSDIINAFNASGGHGVLYTDEFFNEMVRQIDETAATIRGLY